MTTEDTEAIRADIAATRAELGDTVEALAAKTDVKARAKESVAAVEERAADAARTAVVQVKETVRRRPAPVAAVLAGLAALVGAVMVVRRRRAARRASATRLRLPRRLGRS
jgi:hypothetical protein